MQLRRSQWPQLVWSEATNHARRSRILLFTVLVVLVVLVAGVAGCDVLQDATRFTFCTDELPYSLNADELGIASPGEVLPQIPCTSDGQECSSQTQVGCDPKQGSGTYDCELECLLEQSQPSCAINATVVQPLEINLSTKVSGQTSANTLSKVTLGRVVYRVPSNTANFTVPEVELHVGPRGATQPSSDGVELLGRTEAIGPSVSFAEKTMQIEASGQQRLTDFVKDYRTPFQLLTRMQTHFAGGDALPSGAVQVRVKACFQAQVL